MTDPRVEIVAAGYDAIGERFDEWRDRIRDDPRAAWADELVRRLPADARVLELGCGSGTPETRLLAESFRVTGVDVSREQIRRARANVSGAEFLVGDFTTIELPVASFEAVAAFYSFNHVPRELLGPVFERIRGWLVAGGWFLAALGAGDTPGWTGEWLGAPTFFSSFGPATNRRLLAEAGFALERDEVVPLQEPDGTAEFHWVLARR